MKLEECEVGLEVAYSPRPGVQERGVITQIRSEYVLVRFDGERLAKACKAWQLELDYDPNLTGAFD